MRMEKNLENLEKNRLGGNTKRSRKSLKLLPWYKKLCNISGCDMKRLLVLTVTSPHHATALVIIFLRRLTGSGLNPFLIKDQRKSYRMAKTSLCKSVQRINGWLSDLIATLRECFIKRRSTRSVNPFILEIKDSQTALVWSGKQNRVVCQLQAAN